jgi:hypothetical protein
VATPNSHGSGADHGDGFLKAQRVAEGGAVHLDLHTDDVGLAAVHALALGATLIADRGYTAVASPGRLDFCVVGWNGEASRPRAGGQSASLVDQVCLDILRVSYEPECAFSSVLTGWEIQPASREEFRAPVRPDGTPLRMLAAQRFAVRRLRG